MRLQLENLNDKLNALIPPTENARSFAIWIDAPTALVDAVQTALDSLNEAAEIAAKEIERRKDSEMLKELKTMLEAYKAVKVDVAETTARLAKVAQTCKECNAGLDEIFADFADETNPEGEAAAEGEPGDGTEGTDGTNGGDGGAVEGQAEPSGEV